MSPELAAALARVAYEAGRAYAHSLGNDDQPSWEQASPRQRMQAMVGVQAVLSGEARSGAHLHAAWTGRAPLGPFEALARGYEQLELQERRRVLLFRAVVLAMVDGPCNGFCHDDKCANPEDHDCHLDTCMSRFGVPPGMWRAPVTVSPAAADGARLYS
jgi:hypothetical protein